jgi:peroxiredoxin
VALKPGDTAPDCTFQRPDGSAVRLSDFPARALVLIFLRHLA